VCGSISAQTFIGSLNRVPIPVAGVMSGGVMSVVLMNTMPNWRDRCGRGIGQRDCAKNAAHEQQQKHSFHKLSFHKLSSNPYFGKPFYSRFVRNRLVFKGRLFISSGRRS
jgi:hypothetical protein